MISLKLITSIWPAEVIVERKLFVNIGSEQRIHPHSTSHYVFLDLAMAQDVDIKIQTENYSTYAPIHPFIVACYHRTLMPREYIFETALGPLPRSIRTPPQYDHPSPSQQPIPFTDTGAVEQKSDLMLTARPRRSTACLSGDFTTHQISDRQRFDDNKVLNLSGPVCNRGNLCKPS